jgi:hypothetical protein
VIQSLLVLAQLTSVAQPIYSSAAVRDLVTRATSANHAPPPDFGGYRAYVETEFSVLRRDSLGRERSAHIEQVASSVHLWRETDTRRSARQLAAATPEATV